MKILITGASGFLGSALLKELSAKHNVLGLYNNTPVKGGLQADITDLEKMKEVVEDFGPEVVLHTAAISKAEIADKMPREDVMDINVIAAQNIAELCAMNNAKLIYTSTDLVYSGNEGGGLKEDGPVDPASYYAETKLMGELGIRNVTDNYVILRTALLYGLHSKENFFYKTYEALNSGKKINLFYDQYRSPLSVWEAAKAIEKLCSLDIKEEAINFGGTEKLSRLEMGEILCEEAGLDKSGIVKTSVYDMKDVPLCPDVSMNTDKLKSLGIEPKNFRESLTDMLKTRGV